MNTGYFTDFFAQSGLGGEKSTKYLHYKFDQVCLEFLTGRWNKYDSFADKYVGKLVSTQSNEILEDTEYLKKINEAYAPFKKIGVPAKQLAETLKRSQESLKKPNAKNAKLTEELNAYKDACGGSIESIEEAINKE